MKRITGSLVVCTAAAVVAAGALFVPADDPGPAAAPPGTVQISGFRFSAATVRRGATVTVTNRDSVDHTVTADAGGFNAKAPGDRSIAFRAPARPGPYRFHCAIHPEMTGTLVVS